MAQAAAEADGARRGPDPRPTRERLGLSVLWSPPTAPHPLAPNLPPLGAWLGKREKKKKRQPLQASISASSRSLWLSFPANSTYRLPPAWLWQRPGLRECGVSVGAGGELGARILDGRERKQRGEGKRLVGCPCPLKQHSLGTGPH